jgi:uncharacterized protein (TIGR03435 family)
MLRRLLLAGWVFVALPAFGQSADAVAPAFDVVSIKLHDGSARGSRFQTTPDRFTAENIPVQSMIMTAYNLKSDEQLSGLRGPVASVRFDLQATIDADTVEALKKLPMKERDEKRQLMMQAMLADRFKLKAHHETKDVSMYALVVAKGGPKLKEADLNDTNSNGLKGPDGVAHAGRWTMAHDSFVGQYITMASLAGSLTGLLHRIVEDKTDLKAQYDFSVQFSTDDIANAGAGVADAGAKPSIFTALQEQLGLKLEPTKGSVDTIVIDHIEMPSAN